MASQQVSNSKSADGRRAWKTSTYRPAEDGRLPPRTRSRSPPPRRAAPPSAAGYDPRLPERREVHDDRDRRELLERERRAREELDRRRQQPSAPMYSSPPVPPEPTSRDPYRERLSSQAYDPRSAPPNYIPPRSAYDSPSSRHEYDDRPLARAYDDYRAPSSIPRQYDYTRPSPISDSAYGSVGYERPPTIEPPLRAHDPYYPPSSYPPYEAPRGEAYGRSTHAPRNDYPASSSVRDLPREPYSREPVRRDEGERGRARARSPIPPRQDEPGAPVTEQEPVHSLEDRKRRGPCKRYPHCFQGVACAFWHEDENLNTRKASEKQESLIEKGKWQNFSKQRRSPSPSVVSSDATAREPRRDVHSYESPRSAAPIRLADRVEPAPPLPSSRYSERDAIKPGPVPSLTSDRGRSPVRASRPDDRANFYADLDRRRRGVCRDYPGCQKGEECLWWHEDERHNAEVVRNGRDPREMITNRDSDRLGSSVTRRGEDRYAPIASDRRDERLSSSLDRRDDRPPPHASYSTRTDIYYPRDDPRTEAYAPPPPAPAPYPYDDHLARSERSSYARPPSPPPRSLLTRADAPIIGAQSEAERYRLIQEDRRRRGPCKWYPGCHRGRECVFWHEDEVYNELKYKEKKEKEILFDKQRDAPLPPRSRYQDRPASPPRSAYESDRHYGQRSVAERNTGRERLDRQSREHQPIIREGRPDHDGRHYVPDSAERRLGGSTSRRQYEDDQLSSNVRDKVRFSLESRKKRGLCRYYPTCFAGEFCKHHHPDEDFNIQKSAEKKAGESDISMQLSSEGRYDDAGKGAATLDRYVPDSSSNSLLSRIGKADLARDDSMQVEQTPRLPKQEDMPSGSLATAYSHPPEGQISSRGSRIISGQVIPLPAGEAIDSSSIKRESPPDQNKAGNRPRASDFMFEQATVNKTSSSANDPATEDATMAPTLPHTNGISASTHANDAITEPASVNGQATAEIAHGANHIKEHHATAEKEKEDDKPVLKAESGAQAIQDATVAPEPESKQSESEDAQMEIPSNEKDSSLAQMQEIHPEWAWNLSKEGGGRENQMKEGVVMQEDA